MSEELILTFVEYNFFLILFLLLVKGIHFYFLKTRRKTFKNFVFFSESNLYGTKDPKKKRQKLIQNILSVAILILILLQVFVFLSGAFFKRKPEE